MTRTAADRAREAAERYARIEDPVEKCLFAGELMFRTIYAGVAQPDRYDDLLAKRRCARMPQQVPPWLLPGKEDVQTWIACGGRGAGKTYLATSWIVPEALRRPNLRVGVLGPDFTVSVNVGIKGPSGIKTRIEAFDKSLIARWDDVKNELFLINGSQIKCFSSDSQKNIEGHEFHLYWVDEVAELRGQGGDNCIWRKRAEPGIRLLGDSGEPTRAILTGTPEATPLYKDLHDSWEEAPDEYEWTQLATRDNIGNLDQKKVTRMYREAGDSLFAKMKLEGHLILESPNALLNEMDLSKIRVGAGDARHRTPEDMDTVVLVVDANHSDDKKSDECGIIVAGRRKRSDDARIAHIFADASIGEGPKKWGERIIEALIAYPEIDQVVVEDDKSLVIDVVERVLREDLQRIGRPIKVVPIHHKNRSKKQRADPVAVEYQLQHVLHDPCPRVPAWASMTALEWQWVSWNPKDKKAKSPDRVDAAVYAGTHLLLVGRATDSFHAPGN